MRSRDESGAYLILYALLGVGFVTMAAIVLDLSSLRQGRGADRAAADLAVTAGVAELDAGDPQTFAGACEAAWGYALANRTTAGATTAPPCTTTFPDTVACDAATAQRTATGTIGTVTVEITHPVPDTSPLLRAEAQGGDVSQSIVAAADGTACERLAVRIIHPHRFLFAQVAGDNGGTTDVHAVARASTTPLSTEIPGVVALERTGCDGVASPPAGGALRVGSASSAGLIVVDSDASTCPAGHTISAGVSGDPAGRVVASTAGAVAGRIQSYALSTANFARAYDPGAVGDGRLAPQPDPSLVRTGHALIDSRYNCASCGTGTFIDQLTAARSGPGAPAGSVTYAGPCTILAIDPPVQLAGHVYVDCDPFVVAGQVTFLGDAVTFRGAVQVADTGCLAVNDATCGAVGVVLQDVAAYARGSFIKAPLGRVILPRTMLYTGGVLDAPGDPLATTGLLSWTAPLGGDFEDLLLWSDNAGPFVIGKQSVDLVEGTLFTPNATLIFVPASVGGATWSAQAIAGRVHVQGSGTVTLDPDATRATGRLGRQVRLIR